MGGSYSSIEIDKQAKGLFNHVNTEYSGVEGDSVYQGIPFLRKIGLGMIGNNPNAHKNNGLTFAEAHSEANQNINNLKYVYRKDNEEEKQRLEKTKKVLMKTYSENRMRKLNKVEENNNEK